MRIRPTQNQLAFLDWEIGVFFHFGIRTFYEGHKDWDMRPMPLQAFNPKELNCEEWIETIKEAGAKYAVFVTKHHDGFANWPSQYTTYSVQYTPWKDGKGDIVQEYVDACRKHQIKVGLYYSPAEFGLKEEKKTAKEYDDYFINQISELLTQYGEIDYLWFDGCGSEGHGYDQQRIINTIRTLQPNIMIFNMWDPDTRWAGNEAGVASFPCYNTVDSLDFSVLDTEKTHLGDKKFLPAECDCKIRLDNWFYSENDEDTLKSLDELMGMYYYSVGRGANLLMNIGPDRSGKLPQKDADRFLAFGREVKKRFQNPIKSQIEFIETENKYILSLVEPTIINHVVLAENLMEGESIKKFRASIKPYHFGKDITVFEGYNVGHKAICQFPAIYTHEVSIEILDFDESYSLSGLELFYVNEVMSK